MYVYFYYIYICVSIYVHLIYIYIYMYVYLYVYIYTYVQRHSCTSVLALMYIMCVCVSTSVCVCICLCLLCCVCPCVNALFLSTHTPPSGQLLSQLPRGLLRLQVLPTCRLLELAPRMRLRGLQHHHLRQRDPAKHEFGLSPALPASMSLSPLSPS